MTDVQLSQLPVEVIRTNTAVDAQASQVAVEVLRPNAAVGYTLTASAGSYALTGIAATFRISDPSSAGSYALTFSNAGLSRNLTLSSVTGSYDLTGKNASFVRYTSSSISANVGDFLLTGNTATFAFGLGSNTGAFNVSVNNSALKATRFLTAETRSASVTASDAGLLYTSGTIIACGKGGYLSTFSNAGYLISKVFSVSTGEYIIVYPDIDLLHRHKLQAAKAEFTATGNSANVRKTNIIFSASRGEYTLGLKAGYPYKHTTGPFYFAWTDSSDNVFSHHHKVYEENIFSFNLTHEEGQIPVLQIEIKNPKSGLLNSSRNKWCWFSWTDGSTVYPLFYGRLVGIPSDILGEVVQLQFVARATDYLEKKQALGQSLKVAPFYNTLFIDASSQDNPDAIIEGYAASWHIDRTSLNWTISDIIVPEDGTKVLSSSDVYYDSVQVDVVGAPLKSVTVTSSVNWQNSISGSAYGGYWTLQTMYGSGFISSWPKPGTSLGGGWTVGDSFCYDVFGADKASVTNISTSWQNTAQEHNEGDTMSFSESTSELANYYFNVRR